VAEINQKISSDYLEKMAQQTEKLKIEKEAYANLVNFILKAFNTLGLVPNKMKSYQLKQTR